MSIEIEIDTSAVEEAIDKFEGTLDSQLTVAMSLAMDRVANDASMRAPQGETGHLRQSIQALPTQGRFSSGDLEGQVTAAAPYALYVEEGTRAHVIRPRHRRALKWPVEGGFRWAKRVKHPGTRPQPFMGPAIESIVFGDGGEVGRILDDAVAVAARQAGL